MPIRSELFAICLLFAVGCKAIAQSASPSTPDYQFTSGAGSSTTAFQRYANLILIPVSVNGSKPIPFALDSGSGKTVIDSDAAAALGLNTSSPDPENPAALTASNVTLGWTGFAWLNCSPVVASLSGLTPVLGKRIDGIIGADLFARFIVEVNYQRATVSIYDPAGYVYSGTGDSIDLQVRGGLPVVAGAIDDGAKPIPAMLEIDTGSVDGLTLNGSFAESSGFAGSARKTVTEPAVVHGELPLIFTRAKSVRLKGFVLNKPIVAISAVNSVRVADGSVGAPILSRFTVVFDYPDKIVYLEPNQPIGAAGRPFPFDASGLILTASGPNHTIMRVAAVLPGTPADAAGLKRGDVITSISGKPASAMSLDNLRRLLQEPGKTYRLEYMRAGQAESTTIVLTTLL